MTDLAPSFAFTEPESTSYIPLYREQLPRWERTELTTEQRRKVDRLKPQVDDLAEVF